MGNGLEYYICSSNVKAINGRRQFDCGEKVINNYLRDNFLDHIQNSSRGGVIVLDTQDNNKIIGFYCISPVVLHAKENPSFFSKGFPNSIPVLKVWMIGVDKNYQNQHIGRELMAIAIEGVMTAKKTGCVAIILDAAPNKINFYQNLGFKQFQPINPDGSLPMILKIEDIEASKK